MKIIGKMALSLILPTLMTINVHGEETSATTTIAKGTTTEKAGVTSCTIPPACPPDRSECCDGGG